MSENSRPYYLRSTSRVKIVPIESGDALPGCSPEGGAPDDASRLVYHAKTQTKLDPGTAMVLSEHAQNNGDYPVESVDVYRRDCITRRVRVIPSKNPPIREIGVRIKEFSDRAMRRLIHKAKNCNADFVSMLTLTYPNSFPMDGRKVKSHWASFAKAYRSKFASRCLWWLEFQMRGAPHFHVLSEENLDLLGPLVTRKRPSKTSKGSKEYQTNKEASDWLANRWYNIVGSKDENHLRAGTAWEVIESKEGAWVYAASHAGKRKQKTVPEGFTDVGRFWGEIGELIVERFGTRKIDTSGVFQVYGCDALSREGKCKKYLYDGAKLFAPACL